MRTITGQSSVQFVKFNHKSQVIDLTKGNSTVVVTFPSLSDMQEPSFETRIYSYGLTTYLSADDTWAGIEYFKIGVPAYNWTSFTLEFGKNEVPLQPLVDVYICFYYNTGYYT